MTRNRNAAANPQPAQMASAAPRADGRAPARRVAEPLARPPRKGRGALRRLAIGALVALGLVAGASAQAALTATDPSSDGAYTVSWTAITGASKYQLLEDGTKVYEGTARSKSFTGKAAGSYVYTLTYCRYVPAPVRRTVCGLPSNFAALTVTVPEPTATPAPAAPTLTVPATDTDGSYKVTWTRPTSATSYQLEEKTNSGSWGSAYSGSGTSKSYSNKGTAVYAYRVKACAGADNCGRWSAEKSVRVTRAASTLSASPNPAPGGTYTVRWTASRLGSYVLKESVDGGTAKTVYTGTGRSKRFTGKGPGSYAYSLSVCFSLLGGQTCVQAGSLTVTVPRPTVTPPAAPTLTVPETDTDGSYRVSWTRPSRATSYALQEKTNNGSWGSAYSGANAAKSFTGKSTAVYAYRVKACAGAGNCSGWSAEKSVQVTRSASVLSASPNPAPYGSYTVRWTASSLGSYVLKESVDGATPTTVHTGAGRSKRFTGRAPGSYAYTLTVCFSLLGNQACVDAGALTVTVPEPQGSISAAPSPCVFAAGKTRCSTTVEWSTQNAATPCVFLQHSEGKFACTRSGSKAASWITASGATFLLKAGNTFASETLASVTVKGVHKPTATASFSPAAIDLRESSTLTWSSTHATRCSGSPSIGSTNPSGTKSFTPTSAGEFEVTVTCTGAGGSASATAAVTVRPDSGPSVPDAPARPTVTAPGATTLDVQWTAPADNGSAITHYHVRHRVLDAPSWTTRTHAGTARSATITGLSPYTTYQVQVRARNGAGNGLWSSPARQRTPDVVPDRPAPPTVTGTTASSLTVAWTAPASRGSAISDYDVQYRKASVTGWTNHAFAGTGASTVIEGLAADTAYQARVRAGNLEGESPWSGAGSGRTLADTNRAPVANDDRATTLRGVAVAIAVLANDTDADADDTLTVASATTPANGTARVNTDGTVTYTPRGTFVGTDTFRYTVSDGTATASAAVTVEVVQFIAIPNPSADGNYTVRWAALTGATQYLLLEDGTAAYLGRNLSRTFSNKARGSYVYTLMKCIPGFRGVPNCRTDSGYGELRVQVGASLPAAPTGLAAAPNPSARGEFRVSWSASTGATRYELQERLSGDWSEVHDGAATRSDISGRAITGTTPYRYRVRACDGNRAADCGEWSTELTVRVTGALWAEPNPSTDGAYTVHWTPSRVATRYKLDESTDGGATWPVTHAVTATRRAFTGKADDTYTYRVRGCVVLGLPVGREVCTPLIPTRTDAKLDVVVARRLAPPTLTVAPEVATDGSYRVSWGTSAGAASYVLQERTDGGSWSTVTGISGRAKNFTGRGVGVYGYHVRACTAGNDCGVWSPEKSVRVPPAVPTGLTVPETDADGSYTVSWTASTGADRYVLEENDGGATWTVVAKQASDALTSRAVAKTADGTFSYRVKACKGDANCSAPGTPKNVAVLRGTDSTGIEAPETSTGSHTVRWSELFSGAAYTLRESTDGGTTWKRYATGTARSKAFTNRAVNTYTYDVEGCITIGTFRIGRVCVSAHDDYGWAYGTTRVPPAAPANLQATTPDANGNYTVSWDAATGADGYVLEESADGGSMWSEVTKQASDAVDSRAVRKTAGGTFNYRVKACQGSANCGSWSGAIKVTVSTLPVVTPPTECQNGRYAVEWSTFPDATRYELQRRTGNGNWSFVYRNTGTSTRLALDAGTTYSLRARSCRAGAGCTDWGPVVTFVAPKCIGVPGGFAVEPMGPDDYTVQWNAVTNAARYELERSANGGNWKNVHNAGTRSKAYRNEANGTYRYQVRACPRTGDCGDWAGPVSVTVPIPTPVPQNLRVSQPDAQGGHTVEWDPVSFGSGILYLLDQTHRNSLTRHTVGGTSKTFAAPTPGDYAYQVKACIGFSDCSDESPRVTVTVPPRQPGPVTLPGACVNGEHTVRWPAVTGADRYELRHELAGGGWSPDYAGAKPETTLGLSAGTSYSFQARACLGRTNCGAWSATATLTAAECARLAAPGGLAVDATDPDDYRVDWDDVAGADRYDLQESTDDGATWPTTYTPSMSEQTIAGQSPGTYKYRVRACPTAGDCGDWSETVDLTVPIPPPAPENLAATDPHNGAYTVSWDAVTFGPGVAYELQERMGAGNGSKVHDGTATRKAVTGKTGGIYGYRVRTCAGAGNCGDWSDALSVTVMGSPGAFVLSADPNPSATGIYTVSWNAPAGAHSYRLSESADGGVSFKHLLHADRTGSVQISGKPSGTYQYRLELCAFVSLPFVGACAEVKRQDVVVELPAAPDVVSETVPGSLAYAAGVTKGGDAYVNIPIEPAPGVNGLEPRLSIDYSGGRELQRKVEFLAGDTLGYGWRVSGFSTVRRCIKHQAANATIGMDINDSLCLDGEPLVLINGTHFSAGAEYRTLRESFRRVVLNGTGNETWFEVAEPDGSISEYGRTADSRLRNVDYVDVNGLRVDIPTVPFTWSINKRTDAFDNTIEFTYHKDEVASVLHPKEISYGDGGDAVVRFDYVHRDDLSPVSFGTISQSRHLLLHTVRVELGGRTVRSYRLISRETDGRRQLDKVQLCGFDEAGSNPACLAPLAVSWGLPRDGQSTVNLPDGVPLVTQVTDPLGRATAFEYSVLRNTGNPSFLLADGPFGTLTTAPNDTTELTPGTGGILKAVVTKVKRHNGLKEDSAGRQWHVTDYAYQGRGRLSTRHWGFLGFDATRVTDTASGIVTYYQYRMDFPYLAEVAAVRQYDRRYDATGSEILSLVETGYDKKSLNHPVKGVTELPYVETETEFHYEGGQTLGLTRTENTLTLKHRLPHSLVRTVRVAHDKTSTGGGSPWGAPPQYSGLTDVQRKTVTTTKFLNRTVGKRHLIAFVDDVARADHANDGSSPERTASADLNPWGSTNRIGQVVRFNSSTTEHRLDTQYSYDTHGSLTATTVSGVNVLSRTSEARFATGERRYPQTLENALDHAQTLTWDRRFGLPKNVTDPNGRTTRIAYDAFGRETRRVTPDGVTVATTHQWCSDIQGGCAAVGATNAVKPVIRVRTTSSVAPTRTLYLDRLGRTIRTEVQGFDDGEVVNNVTVRRVRREDVVYDERGLVAQVSQPYHAGDTAYYTQYTYDTRGRVTSETRPDKGRTDIAYARNPDATVTDRNHQVQVRVTESLYDTPQDTTAELRRRVDVYNVLGELVRTTEGATGASSAKDRVTTDYAYDGSGLLKTVSVNGSYTTTFTYDAAGARDSVTNPNFGTVNFGHTALGQLRTQTDALSQATTYHYDLLGRLTKQEDADGVAEWSYDPTNAKGALHQRCYEAGARATACLGLTAPDFMETLTYDGNARVKTAATDIRHGSLTKDYEHRYTYDSHGRPSTVRYPSGLSVTYGYNGRGYRETVSDTATDDVLQTYTGMNAFGQVTRATFGNGVASAWTHDPRMGRLTDIDTTFEESDNGVATTTRLQQNRYAWRSDGILRSRMSGAGTTARTETFGYDLLNRMTSAALTVGSATEASRTLGYTYDRLGNVTGRDSTTETNLESTVYGARNAGPNALTGATFGSGSDVETHVLTYDAAGKAKRYDRPPSHTDAYIDWNGRALAESITVGDSAMDTSPEARDSFAYGPEGRRYHRETTWDDGGTQRTEHTYYVGNFEERTLHGHASYSAVQKTRVSAGVLHVRKIRKAPATGADTAFEYVHRDHLGSVEKVTDANGDELVVLSYDPFGSRRKSDWTARVTDTEHDTLIADLKLRTSDGFSGHEHLERTGFVHMGGRVYDPQLMRFLSPDPVVTRPTSSQSWNSYGYAMNSPLSYVDPDGLTFAPVESGCSVFISSCNPGGHGGGFSRITQTLQSTIQEIWVGFFVVHIPLPGPSYGGYPGDYGGFGFGLPSYWSSIPVPVPFLVEGPTRTVERHEVSKQPSPTDEPLDPPKVIDTRVEAVMHYYFGGGKAVELGEKTKAALKNSAEQQYRLRRIKSGHTSPDGNYGVDLTEEVFHVGRTTVQYSTECDLETCTTTFTGFRRKLPNGEFGADGFWDVRTEGDDAMGPEGEYLFGKPYEYRPYEWKEPFPNPDRN